MKHIRSRYTLDKLPFPVGHPDLIYAVADHQTGRIVARGLTWDSAHHLIDKLEGVNTSPEPDEDASIAERAYAIADRMLAERAKGGAS